MSAKSMTTAMEHLWQHTPLAACFKQIEDAI